MTLLITGGAGCLGAELAHQLVESGQPVIAFDNRPDFSRLEAIRQRITFVQGDVGDSAAVEAAIRGHGVTEIYHLAAILGNVSENEHVASFHSNVAGTFNVFEAARNCGVEKVLFASSTGTYGWGLDPDTSGDETRQAPGIVYGVEKLYGEGLGRWFRNRHGLDYRGIRYAQVMAPNFRHCWVWAPAMIEDAALGRPHVCDTATPDSTISMLYIRDAARAAIELMAAPKEAIQTVNYNVVGVQELISAPELEALLKAHFSGFQVTYAGPGRGQRIAPLRYDDSRARQEWGWQPQYASFEAIVEAFILDVKNNPARFGL
jgi:nucleoside-diphosphate-sugar epimerase